MTPNHRKLLQLCIENGIRLGLVRAHKHVENPDERTITEAVDRAIWEEIDEFFDWQQGVQ
jgi:hypothetical protein